MAELEKKTFTPGEGDWTCEDNECGNINYARRTECNRCKAPRSTKGGKVKPGGIQIGKHLAEKSKGLFSADDWQCATCGNVNWARRNDCNLCHAPKFGKVEERTGAGGGFNERGTVEYKSHVESDEEFDDYGRPKKKRRTSSTSMPLLTKEESGDEDEMGRYALDDSSADGSSSGSSTNSSSDSEPEHKGSVNKMKRKPQSSKSSSKSPSPPKDRSRKSSSRSRSRSRKTSSRSRSEDKKRSRSKSRERRHSRRDSPPNSRKRSRSPRRRKVSSGSRSPRMDRYWLVKCSGGKLYIDYTKNEGQRLITT